jgi:hypothetical protein
MKYIAHSILIGALAFPALWYFGTSTEPEKKADSDDVMLSVDPY